MPGAGRQPVPRQRDVGGLLDQAARIAARAAPTRLPASALAAGGSAPISALASVIGALSPAWASRAAFSSSRVAAAAMAASASSSMRCIASGDRVATSTGS